ncbi:hypothetical protein LshimejAT787_0410470 [Lyophyllum shimeji]|uniref:Uncharacterized protein n=1 Tax=Lyophyllum shimeji TaxID=47721 RepID=A0A9P3PMF6_LYOSH|nr:hypothetical protein LshimejAT787_0410470 [Lyophyllum shimeji]
MYRYVHEPSSPLEHVRSTADTAAWLVLVPQGFTSYEPTALRFHSPLTSTALRWTDRTFLSSKGHASAELLARLVCTSTTHQILTSHSCQILGTRSSLIAAFLSHDRTCSHRPRRDDTSYSNSSG